MPKGRRLFGRKEPEDAWSDSSGRDVPINEHLLEDAVSLLDGVGWTVFELMRQPGQESDGDDRMQFLTNWRNLRHALTENRRCEFNYYGGAHEWYVDTRYVFRDGSAFHRADDEGFEQEAVEQEYRLFMGAYDPGEDPRA